MTKQTAAALHAQARVAKLLGRTQIARALDARARVAALLVR